MRVAVHQPNLLPGLAFFAKLAQVDTFVLLDDVQLSRPSYTTRVEIMRGTDRVWLTLPIDPWPTWALIRHARIDEAHEETFGEEIAATLIVAYLDVAKTSEHVADFADVIGEIRFAATNAERTAGGFNAAMVRALARLLGLDMDLPLASDFRRVPARRNCAVSHLLHVTGATVYVPGAGEVARGIHPERYKQTGVTVEPTRWRHPADSGVPEGLSIIDTIARLGLAGTRALIDRGIA